MNKTKLIFPLAALLMMPAMTSCGPDKYQASFNTDQHISAYGPQVIDITLNKNVKNKMHFKDSLKADMFVMPEKYKAKEITSAYSYNNGASAVIIFKTADVTMAGNEDTFNIKVKESAFKEPNLGGEISVTMYQNHIKYAAEPSVDYDESENFCFGGLINIVGEIVTVLEDDLDTTENGNFKVECIQGGFTATGGSIRLYELGGNLYFLETTITKDGQGDEQNAKFALTFKGPSTNLGEGYQCTIELAEHPSKSYFAFEKN